MLHDRKIERSRVSGPLVVLLGLTLVGFALFMTVGGGCGSSEPTTAPSTTTMPSGRFGELRRIGGLDDPVLGVVMLPDGRHALSCGGRDRAEADFTIRLWDVETGKEIRRFAGHEKEVRALAVSPDGLRMLTGGLDGTARIWDVGTGRELTTDHEASATVLCAAISADGRLGLTGGSGPDPLALWDLVEGRRLKRFGGEGQAAIGCVAFSADGRQALTGAEDQVVRLWDLEKGEVVRRFEGHEGSVRAVAFSADGRSLFSAGGKSVRTWDRLSGRETRRAVGFEPIDAAQFAPDGRRALLAFGKLLWLVDRESGGMLGALEAHEAMVHSLAFAADGQKAVSGGRDRTVRVWELSGAPPSADRTLAVLDFADLGPSIDLAALRKALTEMLVGNLSPYMGLRVVERSRVEHVLAESQLGQGGLVDESTAQRAGRELAADLLLSGTIAGSDGNLTVKAVLRRVGSAAPLAEWTLQAPSSRFFDLGRDLSGKVSATLGLEAVAHRPPPAPQPGASPTVAVLGFKDLSPTTRLRAMESGFADILTANLGGLKDVTTVEREKLDALLREQNLTLSGLVDADAALRVGRLLGAQRLIYGSFIEIGEELRVESRLVDTSTATVLQTETAQGKSSQFADLLEDLALRLARDLAITPPADAARLVRAATPTRKLEAAGYYASGEEAFRQGRFADSAASFERALLLEPDSMMAHFGLGRGLNGTQNYPRLIEVAIRGSRLSFTPEQWWYKESFNAWLSNAYWGTQQHQKLVDQCKKWIADEPHGRWVNNYRMRIASTLTLMGRHEEAIAFMKQLIDDEKAKGDSSLYDQTLRDCFLTLRQHCQSSNTSYRDAAMAIEVFELMLKSVEKKRTPEWDAWAGNFLLAIDLAYSAQRRVTSTGVSIWAKAFLTPEQQVGYLQRMLKTFSDLPYIRWRVHESMAKHLEDLERWAEARESFLYIAAHAEDFPGGRLPCPYDSGHWGRTHWLHKVIKARVEAAEILRYRMNDMPGAIKEYREILRDYGLGHQEAVRLAWAIQEYAREPLDIPAKSALIVGGAADAYKQWNSTLKPKGYTVHSFDLDYLSAADLAPYSLVILVRQGELAWFPTEIMAFRSYVAKGGSLLAVVSPGWKHAQPGLTNPILAPFGIHARPEGLPMRVESTELAQHPITEGITKVTFKYAVGLEAPPEASIVKAGKDTIMAARSYGEGRVVVATMAPWFLTGFANMGKWWERCELWAKGVPADQFPLEGTDRLEIPLLNNALAWLGEPIEGRGPVRRLPDDFLKAYRAGLEVQLRARSRDELPAILDAFVANSGPHREEALWMAGQALKPMQWFHRWTDLYYGWPSDLAPLRLDPRYFEELVKSYPQSELRPYAQWEIAEFARLNRYYDAVREGRLSADEPVPVEGVSSLFEKVDAPKGSYPWAWAKIRLAMLAIQEGQPARAIEHAQPVTDMMDQGPEKVLALFLAGLGAEDLGNNEDATRYYEFVKAAPPMVFPASRDDIAWAPMRRPSDRRRFHYWRPQTTGLVQSWINGLKPAGP